MTVIQYIVIYFSSLIVSSSARTVLFRSYIFTFPKYWSKIDLVYGVIADIYGLKFFTIFKRPHRYRLLYLPQIFESNLWDSRHYSRKISVNIISSFIIPNRYGRSTKYPPPILRKLPSWRWYSLVATHPILLLSRDRLFESAHPLRNLTISCTTECQGASLIQHSFLVKTVSLSSLTTVFAPEVTPVRKQPPVELLQRTTEREDSLRTRCRTGIVTAILGLKIP